MEVFVISDLHIGHKNILTFCDRETDSLLEMNELIVTSWNDVVKRNDLVYILGDVALNHRTLPETLTRLNGKKRLVMGNHENDKRYAYENVYSKYFERIGAYKELKIQKEYSTLLSHMPVYPQKKRYIGNIHGHTHAHCLPDRWYVNVCLDNIGYAPVPISTIVDSLVYWAKKEEKESV